MATFLGLEYYTPLLPYLESDKDPVDSLNLRRRVFSSGANRWRYTAKFVDTGLTAALARLSAHMAIHDIEVPFDIEIPQYVGVEVPTVVVNLRAGNYTSGATSINVSAARGAIIQMGTLIRIPGLTRMYMVVADFDSGAGTSNAALQIRPTLERSFTASAGPLDFTPSMNVTYDNVNLNPVTRGKLFSTVVNFVENLP